MFVSQGRSGLLWELLTSKLNMMHECAFFSCAEQHTVRWQQTVTVWRQAGWTLSSLLVFAAELGPLPEGSWLLLKDLEDVSAKQVSHRIMQYCGGRAYASCELESFRHYTSLLHAQ